MKTSSSSAFTLIELMVVISIIALFSSIGMFTYADARVKANDAKKQVETNQVEKAIILYKDSKGTVPPNYTGTNSVAIEGTPAYTQSMQELVTAGYLPSIPKSTDNTYVYYADASSTSATFGARLKGNAPAPVSKSSCTSIVPPVTYSQCWQKTSVPAQYTSSVVNFDGATTATFCAKYGESRCYPGATSQFPNACPKVWLPSPFNSCGISLTVTTSCLPTPESATSTCTGINKDYCACIQ